MAKDTDLHGLATGKDSLQDVLSGAQPLYILPKDPVIAEVLIPALRATDKLDVMMGYFASSSFADIAPGLATFLRSSQAPMRLVVSPFFTAPDFDTLSQNMSQLSDLARQLFTDEVPGEAHLVRHTIECLAWLITQERLILKVAVMRDALFHPKVWLFDDNANLAALHGSTNMTKTGLSRNREQLTLSRSWKGEEAVYHIDRLQREFDVLWGGGDDDCLVITLPEAVVRKVLETYKTEDIPAEISFEAMWDKAHEIVAPPMESNAPIIAALQIPSHLEYETGPFAHQGEAVKAWEISSRRGILEMATGAGKTITAMICATRLQDEIGKLMVIVSAPYRPLIEQWCEEIREFGITPINLPALGGPNARNRELTQAGRRLRKGSSRAEILVVSNDTFCTEDFIRALETVDAPKLFIADECHNLGAESFIGNPPEVFDYKLGLSATPVRQYDEEGTEALIEYFGRICFSFTLEDAIGTCLTEYDYYVHFIELTNDEMREWLDLTNKIAALSWKFSSDKSDPHLDNLLRKRRLILETASGKLDILAELLTEEGARSLKYALVYATDKNPRQLEQVNELLQNRGVLFHQLTQEETQNRAITKKLLRDFQAGMTQVLTAKRVLDEGVNIPQIKLAYILASTTVKRQWVQRRGRLLRTCSAIGKTHAIIHDFVVVPPSAVSSSEELDTDIRRLVRSELDRVWEFASLARNASSPRGPYKAVEYLQGLANERIQSDGT